MATDVQRQLHQALKAHKVRLEIQRDDAPGCDLNDRIWATGQLLEWLNQAVEPVTFRLLEKTAYAALAESPRRA
jgi:hypothetical protein